MGLQEILDIASRHDGDVADAMVRACVEKALETGERIVPPRRPRARTAPAVTESEYLRITNGTAVPSGRLFC